MQTNQSPNHLGALPESENEIRRCKRRPCFCVRYKAYDSPSHVSCLRCPRMPRKYSFFLSGRLPVQLDDVWTERIATMNKESSSRLERGWAQKLGIVFYDAWWSIEEFVIDRHGLWKYMPDYKVVILVFGT